MAQNVNLNSTEWCELVFEGKNKEYGAYQMRRTSAKRHLFALAAVFLLVGLISLAPHLINAVNTTENEKLLIENGPKEITDLEGAEDEKIVEPLPSIPSTPPLVKSIGFTPPLITDEVIRIEDGIPPQDILMQEPGVVASRTVDTNNTVGQNIDDFLGQKSDFSGDESLNKTAGPIEFAEVMPQYPGGITEMMKFLSRNLRYPPSAIESDIQGRVILKFVVTKEGKIDDINVLKSLDPACDKEAIRVVKMMPKWAAGSQNGNKVAVYYNLPVVFKLQK